LLIPNAPSPKLATLAPVAALCLLIAACEPTVRVEAPKEPITINLNIKLDADVRLKLEEAAKEDIESNPDIF
jgi:hypothetical protein